MSTKLPKSNVDQTPVAHLNDAGLHQVIGYQVALATITTMQVFVDEAGKPFDLRPVEFTLLNLIHENPNVSARQLARALGVTPPNITMWIDKLEKRGLVKRERSTTDARAQHIRVAPAGSALARKSLARVLEGERETLAALSPAERAMLVELLNKVARCRKRG